MVLNVSRSRQSRSTPYIYKNGYFKIFELQKNVFFAATRFLKFYLTFVRYHYTVQFGNGLVVDNQDIRLGR